MASTTTVSKEDKINYLLYIADTALILSHRNSEWCGHAPVLEQDIALTNIALDLLGQARNFYQYAAELIGNNATEDSLAYLRLEHEYKNLLLAEQPNEDWAYTVLRQFYISTFLFYLYQQLQQNEDEQVAAIAAKSIKEVAYHVRWSGEWVIRLGDGTKESNQRMQQALDFLKDYTGEVFIAANYEQAMQIDMATIQKKWEEKVAAVLNEAMLSFSTNNFSHTGGKTGKHTEHLGYILTEMQYLQRTYPNATW
ncbi:MAG: phenylacetate-CoA oxygenase subunit PaaC [Chitinophagales bacterium]|nr:phenylacetate-CoA oxygenase subunit PaaC [Chitinophagales bacterium]